MERLSLTYSGTSISDKPARMMRNEKFHKQVYERYTENVAMTIEQTHYLLADWMDRYNNRPHQDGFYKGFTPNEIAEESLKRVSMQPDFASRIINKDMLNFLMMRTEIKTLYQNGISLFGEWFWNPEFYRYEKGAGKWNFNVFYDWDPNAINSVLVFDAKSGEFICEATKRKQVHPLAELMGTEEDVAEFKRQIAEQNELKKMTIKSAKLHFEDIKSTIPATLRIIEQKEEKRLEKTGKKQKEKISYDMLDLTIPERMDLPEDEPSNYDSYDFTVAKQA